MARVRADVRASDVLEHLQRSAGDIERSLRDFSASAQLFSSDMPRMIDQFESKWIGVFKGRIEAVADTLDDVAAQIESKSIPIEETIVRFVDREEKPLILQSDLSSPVLEARRPLLNEGRHPFLLVLGREQRMEHAPLEAHAFGERNLEGAVDGFLGDHDGRKRHRRDG